MTELHAPARLGRYEVRGLLGHGAMGAVYRAVDPATGQQVAIKTLALAREFEGEALVEARARLVREADAARRLRHPDIAAVVDSGEEQGLAYIAMELVAGHDLQAYTLPGRLLPPVRVAAIGARVADALDHAHRHGVVHRDVKPANVLIDPDNDLVKVVDFGVARIADSTRTRTGMLLGTPYYMSPEQLAGLTIDGRSDLYSLGVMLFQLLTGRLPFESTAMARLMHAIANEPAPDPRSLRPELPETLARAVLRALQKLPAQRQTDGASLAATLRGVN
jgi:eukaryotic-like serine/threonine-protein kinase